MNRWNIPEWLEKEVVARDARCIYCGITFGSCGTRKSKSSWEHIVNDERIITRENIALCCMSCNSSKGAKLLQDWLTNSKYCDRKGINENTVAQVVKNALISPPSLA
ncbi:HNH endonuclease [Uliginosibacterium sp. TH139]|nr:HNH endonuclease [Uliginosibacterium sp. TH139]